LPILKELIEILFQEGLLKALFATETFAMGLNMPAKTVVFTNVNKFDGTDFRLISGGEYIQMSGRAGRRGLDKRGIVIMIMNDGLDPAKAKEMIKGHSDPLNSSFHLGYNMVLNLLRVETIDAEQLMLKSFHQFQQQRALPEHRNELKNLVEKQKAIPIANKKRISDFYKLKNQLKAASGQMRSILTEPINALPFLNPGRLMKIEFDDMDWGWGIMVNFRKKKLPKNAPKDATTSRGSSQVVILDVLLRCSKMPSRKRLREGSSSQNNPTVEPAIAGEPSEMVVVPVELRCVEAMSAVRIYVPKDIRSEENRASVGKSLSQIFKRFPEGLPLLDPVEDMKIQDKDFMKLIRRIESLETRLKRHPMAKASDLDLQYSRYEDWLKIEEEITAKKAIIASCTEDAQLKENLRGMTRVLRRLGHITSDNVVALKGRVACEISSCDELVVAEIILSGMLNDLNAEQCVALLSCLVFRERTNDRVMLKEELHAPLRKLQECVRKVAEAIEDARLPIDVQEYVDKFKPSVMDIVYAWVKGANFADICKLTDIFEGTIIRCIRRLEELMRQMSSAAKIIGNTELEGKFAEGIKKLKRDIIFAASLYL